MPNVTEDSSVEALVSAIGVGIYLVVAEGFKSSAVPKALVANGRGPKRIAGEVIAIVSDQPETSELPMYRISELHRLADQIGSQILDPPSKGPSLSLVVNGVPVSLDELSSEALYGIVKGFVRGHDGIAADPTEIEVAVTDEPARGRA